MKASRLACLIRRRARFRMALMKSNSSSVADENVDEVRVSIAADSASSFILQPSSFLRRGIALAAFTLIASFVVFAQHGSGVKPNAKLGRRIYLEGILPSGKPVRAVMQGDIPVEGTQLNCAGCHRRSGFGSSEGAALVPPVTGPFLFGGRELRRTELFRKLFQEVQPNRFRARLRDPHARPSYTDETFAAALRDGKDPAGREFDPLMPRYDLSDEETAHLGAYMKSISLTPAPGVTTSTIHFATVVTEGVEPERRRALLDVMDAYFRWKNAETNGLLARPGHAAFYDADSYGALREWILHVWELKGPMESWPRQLADYYREQPVFALLGGVGEGSWRPVHDFCEREEIPCLFPDTNLPVVSPAGAYSLYLSGGFAVEAASLATHLRQTALPEGEKKLKPFRKRTCPPPDGTTQLSTTGPVPTEGVPIIQVYRDADGGHVLAEALRRSLQEQDGPDLCDLVIPGAQELSPAFWEKLLTVKGEKGGKWAERNKRGYGAEKGAERPAVLVLWLDDADLAPLAQARVPTDGVRQIYLSSTLLKTARPMLPESFRDKTYLTYPFNLPQAQTPHAFRARAWLRSRGVASSYERLQFNTYFTLAVVDHSLVNLAGNFSRDYFVESVEHETENTPNPGVFPRLSLGPGQRFASKGSYIVKVSDKGIEPASAWVIP